MRTPAEAQIPPSAATRETAASRRGRPAPRSPSVQDAPSLAALTEPPAIAVTAVRLLRVDAGLYALRVGEIAGPSGDIAGMAVPAAHLSIPFAEDTNGVEIIAAYPQRGPWFGREGGTAILRSPPAGGFIIITVYSAPGAQTSDPALDLRCLDGPGNGRDAAATAAAGVVGPLAGADAAARDIPTEILVHIERAGDRLFPGRGWVGALGRRMRIEAFSIRPLERLVPADLEMKGFLPNGGETAWIPGGVLCGTRGRGLPLTGFAVRLAPQRADRFEVLYQGSFFAGGISDLQRNGAPCRAATPDDPLEAINVRLIERVAPGSTDTAA
jgi:hypothetical protein